jgi:hypothetical protein
MFLKFVVFASIMALGIAAGGNARAESFNVVLLPDIADSSVGYSEALGINASGQIVGLGGFDSGIAPIVWSPNGTGMVLNPGAGDESFALGINASGQIVGSTANFSRTGYDAVVWLSNGAGTVLSAVGGCCGDGSFAFGINASGQVVGTSNGSAVLWSASNGSVTVLGAGEANAINDLGQIVGESSVHATLWSASTGAATTLPDIGSQGVSWALGINASGQIAGFSATATAPDGVVTSQEAVLWSALAGTGTALQDVGRTGFSEALAINGPGQIVGFSDTANGMDAVLWDASTGVGADLAGILGSDWTNTQATGINDVGDIVGFGTFMGSGTEGFLMIPTASAPEPSTWVMVLAGLGALGFIVARQTRKANKSAA